MAINNNLTPVLTNFAPVNAAYVTIGNDPTLTNERSLLGTANQILITDNGANSTVVLSLTGPYAPATYTAHGVLLGQGTGSITAVAVPTTAGNYLRSVANADPIWSTLTLPNTATQGDLLAATAANAIGSITAVEIGRVLLSQGASLVPAYTAVPVLGLAGTTAGSLGLSGLTSGVLTLAAAASTTSWTLTFQNDLPEQGDLLTFTNATGQMGTIEDVATGSYLRSAGVSTVPIWSTLTLPNAATQGDLLIATGANAIGNLADVAVGSYLRSGGVGANPLWSTVTLPNTVTTGDVLSASATNVVTVIAAVESGRVLRSTGVGSVSAYTATPVLGLAGTTLGTIGLSGSTAGVLTFAPNINTVSYSLTFPAAVPAQGALLSFSDAVGTITTIADAAVGKFLRAQGAGVVPAYSTATIPDTFVAGDNLVATAANVVGVISAVEAGRVLRSAGTGTVPAYTATPVLGLAGTTQGNIGLSGITAGVLTLATPANTTSWTHTFPAVVPATGSISFYSNGTGQMAVTGTPTDGQILIGSSAGNPALATLTQGTGILITNGNNTITIATNVTGATASTGAPPNITTQTGVQGVLLRYAREDHTHGMGPMANNVALRWNNSTGTAQDIINVDASNSIQFGNTAFDTIRVLSDSMLFQAGATANLGTQDNNALQLRTNNIVRAILNAAGGVTAGATAVTGIADGQIGTAASTTTGKLWLGSDATTHIERTAAAVLKTTVNSSLVQDFGSTTAGVMTFSNGAVTMKTSPLSFTAGAAFTLGTTDAFALNLQANGTTRISIASAGDVSIGSARNVNAIVNDLSVARNANSGAIWFSSGTLVEIDYGVNNSGMFTVGGANLVVQQKLRVDTGVVTGAGLQHKRVSVTAAAASETIATVTWATAFADANYTVAIGFESSNANTSTALVTYRISAKAAGTITVPVINTGISASNVILDCVAVHD